MTPIYRIFDYAQARDFYIDWLGFQIDWEKQPGNPEGYLQVSRDDIILHLDLHPDSACPGSRARAEIRGLQLYHRRLQEKASAFALAPLTPAPWNARVLELVVTDPFGNEIIFCEPHV